MKYNERGDRHERDIMLWRFQYIWTDSGTTRRYDRETRWTGILAESFTIKDIEL